MAGNEPLDLYMEQLATGKTATAKSELMARLQMVQQEVDRRLGKDLLNVLRQHGLSNWMDNDDENFWHRTFNYGDGESFMLAVNLEPLKDGQPVQVILLGRIIGNHTEQKQIVLPLLTAEWFTESLKYLAAPR